MSVWYVFVIHSNSRLDCSSCPYQRSAGVDRAPRGKESERGRDKVSLSPAVWRPAYRALWCLSVAGMLTPPRRTGHQCLIHVGSVNIQRPHGWQICHASLLPWGGRHPECRSAHGSSNTHTRAYVMGSGHGRLGRVVLCDCGGGERVSAGHYDTQTHTDVCIRVKDGACLFGGSNSAACKLFMLKRVYAQMEQEY